MKIRTRVSVRTRTKTKTKTKTKTWVKTRRGQRRSALKTEVLNWKQHFKKPITTTFIFWPLFFLLFLMM